MPDTYVFPQDQPDGKPGQARAGGLTKRELFAAMLMRLAGGGDAGLDRSADIAVRRADALIRALAKIDPLWEREGKIQ